jgi:hypothetical protein
MLNTHAGLKPGSALGLASGPVTSQPFFDLNYDPRSLHQRIHHSWILICGKRFEEFFSFINIVI